MAEARVPSFLRGYWQYIYAVLLTCLLLVLVLMPSLGPSKLFGLPFFRLAFMTVLLASTLTTAKRPLMMAFTIVLAVLGELPLTQSLANGCHIVFFTIVSATVLAELMQVEEVTLDKVLGAICGYLLLALGFAILYTLAANLSPGAFTLENPDFDDLTYFSIITLSTLGYGDIAPVHDSVRALAALEAIIGQFYIAIIVARLVSLYIVAQQNQAR